MEIYCIEILTFILLFIVIYQGWQIKQLIQKGGQDGEVVSIDGLIQKLDKMTTQIKGFIK